MKAAVTFLFKAEVEIPKDKQHGYHQQNNGNDPQGNCSRCSREFVQNAIVRGCSQLPHSPAESSAMPTVFMLEILWLPSSKYSVNVTV